MTRGFKSPVFQTLEEACHAVGIVPVTKGRAGAWISTRAVKSRSHDAGRILFFFGGNGGYCKNHSTGEAALFFYDYRKKMPKAERELMQQRLKSEMALAKAAQDKRASMRGDALPEVCAQLLAAAREDVAPYLRLKRVAGTVGAPSRVIDADEARRILSAVDPSMYDDGRAQGLGGLVGPLLLIPLADEFGVVRSMEFIDSCEPSAQKRYLKGAARRGLIWRPEDLPHRSAQIDEICLAEGVATALSVRRLSGVPCLAALDCGSLLSAMWTITKAYPNANVYIMADSDKPTDAAPEGIGLLEARTAAREFPERAYVRCVPAVTQGQLARLRQLSGVHDKMVTDFNDYEIAICGGAA